LPPCVLFLDRQIQADQGERQADRLRPLVCMLRTESIDRELMDELRISSAPGIAAQIVVRILFRHRSAVRPHFPTPRRRFNYPSPSTAWPLMDPRASETAHEWHS